MCTISKPLDISYFLLSADWGGRVGVLEGVARGGTCGAEGAGLELLLLLPPSPLPLKALILKLQSR